MLLARSSFFYGLTRFWAWFLRAPVIESPGRAQFLSFSFSPSPSVNYEDTIPVCTKARQAIRCCRALAAASSLRSNKVTREHCARGVVRLLCLHPKYGVFGVVACSRGRGGGEGICRCYSPFESLFLLPLLLLYEDGILGMLILSRSFKSAVESACQFTHPCS